MPFIRSPRFRYTLRALLVFVTLFCLWGGYHASRAIKERQAAEILMRNQASFAVGPKRSRGGALDSIRFAYQSLVQLVWRERFITHVSIASKLEPDVEEALAALPYLESLDITPLAYSTEEKIRMVHGGTLEPKVKSPVGAIHRVLARQEIKALSLAGWTLSDDDCRAIAKHQPIESLTVIGSAVSEDGFAQFLTLPRLRHLRFSYTNVTGERLAAKPGSYSLEVIEGYRAPVGNEFAAYVRRCPNVTHLNVLHKAIGDDFVAQLASHPSLTCLDLGATMITDKSMMALQQMPALTVVRLPSETVTQSAVDSLQSARPQLKILH